MSVTVRIAKQPVSMDRCIRMLSSAKVGGISIFVGTVRGTTDSSKRVTMMELEAAKDLAQADLERIAGIVSRRFDVTNIVVWHRIGRLKVGDIIVVIAVGAPHRKDAFSACKFIIDELKKTTPIWKKEFGPGLERWVEAER